MQYIYEFPEATPFDSPLVGMRLNGDSCAQAYSTLRMRDYQEQMAQWGCTLFMPSFSGSTICQSPGETRLTMRFDSIWIIRQNASVGQSWQAGRCPVSGEVVFAQVQSVQEQSFLGLTDSVKHILFYTLDMDGIRQYLPAPNRPLRISKHYGLLSGPWLRDLCEFDHTFELRGMSDPQTGIQNPELDDFFDLQTGDELHVTELRTVPQPVQNYYFAHAQYVLNFQGRQLDSIANTLTLHFLRHGLEYRQYPGPNGVFTDSVFLPEHPYTETFDLQYIDFLEDHQPGALVAGNDFWGDSFQLLLLKESDLCARLEKYLGIPFTALEPDCLTMMLDIPPGNKFIQGLAGPYYNELNLSGIFLRELVFYRSGNESCGDPFDFSTATREADISGIRIHPNPVADRITVTLPFEAAEVTFHLFDNMGRGVMTHRGKGSVFTIPLPAWVTAGIYILHIQTPDRWGRIRIVKH